MVWNISFGLFGSAVPSMVSPRFFPSLHAFGGGRSGLDTEHTSHQQPEHWYIINTALSTKEKHSAIQAAMKKVISILPRRSVCNWIFPMGWLIGFPF